ncbi:MAG: lysylphosphatidylglycerol synthase transmembrane domain-containing protein [Anaerolineales bacterium]|nr:lysylphosphatidylglycerol synthase transmembrane domain-containing protein [Anaerolineales bacterium]
MKKLILIVVLFLGIALVAISFSEIETIIKTLKKAHLVYFILALLIQTLWFFTSARMYKSVYRLLGMDDDILTLTRIATAANFINIITATAGMGGVALFASEARKRGHATGKVTVAAALFLSLDHASFLCVLAVGLFILARRNDLDASDISASLFMLVVALSYAFILYLGYRSEEKLGALLAKLARMVNRVARFFRRKEDFLHEARAYEFAHEVAEGFANLTSKRINMIRPVLWGILDKTLLMLVLVCAFLSFEVPFKADIIVAGFSITFLFITVSPTPSGIGIVEGFMPIALSSLNVDWSQAVVVTLAYRTATFWFPFGVGAWAFRSLHAQEEIPKDIL